MNDNVDKGLVERQWLCLFLCFCCSPASVSLADRIDEEMPVLHKCI